MASRVTSRRQANSRRLELAQWLCAWDRYALAAEAVPHQMGFALAVQHKNIVMEIACDAKAKGRNELVGVLYDEIAR